MTGREQRDCGKRPPPWSVEALIDVAESASALALFGTGERRTVWELQVCDEVLVDYHQ